MLQGATSDAESEVAASRTAEGGVHRDRWHSGGLSVALAVFVFAASVTGVVSGCARDVDEQRRADSVSVETSSDSTPQPTSEPATATHTPLPPTVTPTATAPAPLAAIVNGQFVFLEEYDARLAEYEAALRKRGLELEGGEAQEEMTQVRHDVLEGMIDSELIEQAAESMGVSVDDEELFAQVGEDIEAGGGPTAFDQWLVATGQTEEAYARMVRESMAIQNVMDVIASGVPYEFEQVHARHIAVSSEEEAQAIVERVRQGADFQALARELSEDDATREEGGDLGWLVRGMVEPELEEAAFGLAPGEVSGPVFFGDAYHVVEVVEREAERRVPPEVRAQQVLAAFEDWLEEERASAEIVRLVGE